MGLDVVTYGNIKLAEKKDEYEYDFIAYVTDDSWLYKIKNLQVNKAYTGDVIYMGISYSCSSHNLFREKLVKMIGRDDLLDLYSGIFWNELTPEMPFYDFIDFADNEGCLDWEISSKIYSDFELYKEKARLEMSEHDFSIYETWLETFKSAQNYGVVVFT